MKIIVFLLLFLGISIFGMASDTPSTSPEPPGDQIYKTVNEKGKVIFSDHPVDQKKSQAIKLPDSNIQNPPANIPIYPSDRKTPEVRYQIQLSSPVNGTRFGPAERSVRAAAAVTPNLGQKHQILYFLSGTKVAGPTQSLTADIALGLKQRGAQTLSVSIVDAEGKTLASSSPVTIQVIRP